MDVESTSTDEQGPRSRKRKLSPTTSNDGHTIIPISSPSQSDYPSFSPGGENSDGHVPKKRAQHQGVHFMFHSVGLNTRGSGSDQDERCQLPPEVWQYIFTFLDPFCLGRIMRVNKTFHTILDATHAFPENRNRLNLTHWQDREMDTKEERPVHHLLGLQPPELIWSISRRCWLKSMPRPLEGMNELEMFRLILGVPCQYCGKRPPPLTPPSQLDPWSLGPGVDGIRIIWPFGIRSCGSCFEKHSVKVILQTELVLCKPLMTYRRRIYCFLPTGPWHPDYLLLLQMTDWTILPQLPCCTLHLHQALI